MINKTDLKKYRQNFKYYLIKNPNFFGNLSATFPDMENVISLKGNTSYEELGCVSFNPETNELRAAVSIKKQSGYSGNACSNGSLEYVRFFVDYERDGVWVDEGVTHFNAHDLRFKEALCYGVKLSIKPKKRSCCNDKPILPRVRAILSWDQEPLANDPTWSPVWGNIVEANIQLAPRASLLCHHLLPKFKAVNIDIPSNILNVLAKTKALQKEKRVELLPADLFQLKEKYDGKVEDSRLAFEMVKGFVFEPIQPKLVNSIEFIKKLDFNIDEIIGFIKKPEFNTQYEELKCVALNRSMNILHGAIHIKRNAGYSGNLCEKGSREYIAFYMDFGSGWEYMGTTSVAVHDVKLPKDGLWFNAALPIGLTKHQKKWCKTRKAKVRGILSWNAMPTPNDPDYQAAWGDREECHVEIKPLPKGVSTGDVVPVIDILGGMPVGKIGSISGLATGVHTTVGNVVDAPFDGRIKIQGIITNAPDSSEPLVGRLKYRIMVKPPSFAIHQPLYNEFDITLRELNGAILQPQNTVTQSPDSDGWVDYYPDYKGADLIWEVENLLGEYKPSEQGKHDLYLELLDTITLVKIPSNHVKFFVDKTHIKAGIEITSGSGNCGTYHIGDILEGTFSITDDYCKSMTFSVTPTDEANEAAPVTADNPSFPITYPTEYSHLVYNTAPNELPGNGIPEHPDGNKWKLDTAGMSPCGYNISIVGRERTIVNSNSVNRHAQDIEGFYLKVKDD